MRHHRRNPAPTLSEELDALVAHAALLEDEGEYIDLHRELRPILNRHFGRHLGPSADWVNPTWPIGHAGAGAAGGGLYLFQGDYDDYDVVSRTPNEDPDEPDVIEEVARLPDLDAVRRYFRTRQNPRRKAPPPASLDFQLEASAVQQGLFAPSSYEAKQKEKPRPVVDERQVDLFGMPVAPPPAKKNPRANPTCPKCGGTGKLYSFRHVEKGTCFRCGGTGEVDKLTPAEKGQADPPPPTGSYGVRISSEDYNAILPGYSSFEEANRTRKALAEEHKDATYTVVKFDGKEWRTRSGERANPRRRR